MSTIFLDICMCALCIDLSFKITQSYLKIYPETSNAKKEIYLAFQKMFYINKDRVSR